MGKGSQLLKGILNLFFQPNCALCDRPSQGILCPSCNKQLHQSQFSNLHQLRPGKPPVFIWGSYGGVLKRAIAAMKYEDCPELARPLGHALAEAWINSPLAARGAIAVVPIPMHPEKQKQRGFNQAELLAKHFCDLTRYPLAATGLERIRETEALYALSREERQKTLAQAMDLGKAFRRKKPSRVVLLDDIYTTGATCREAMRVLQNHGIKVYGIVAIASTRKPGDTR